MRQAAQDGQSSEVILSRPQHAQTRIQVLVAGKSVWLTQAQLAELYQATPRDSALNLKAIYQEGELGEWAA